MLETVMFSTIGMKAAPALGAKSIDTEAFPEI
jgi:hypothetical protein